MYSWIPEGASICSSRCSGSMAGASSVVLHSIADVCTALCLARLAANNLVPSQKPPCASQERLQVRGVAVPELGVTQEGSQPMAPLNPRNIGLMCTPHLHHTALRSRTQVPIQPSGSGSMCCRLLECTRECRHCCRPRPRQRRCKLTLPSGSGSSTLSRCHRCCPLSHAVRGSRWVPAGGSNPVVPAGFPLVRCSRCILCYWRLPCARWWQYTPQHRTPAAATQNLLHALRCGWAVSPTSPSLASTGLLVDTSAPHDHPWWQLGLYEQLRGACHRPGPSLAAPRRSSRDILIESVPQPRAVVVPLRDRLRALPRLGSTPPTCRSAWVGG